MCKYSQFSEADVFFFSIACTTRQVSEFLNERILNERRDSCIGWQLKTLGWTQEDRGSSPFPWHIYCIILTNFLFNYRPQCPHMKNGNNDTIYIIGFFIWRFNEITQINCLVSATQLVLNSFTEQMFVEYLQCAELCPQTLGIHCWMKQIGTLLLSKVFSKWELLSLLLLLLYRYPMLSELSLSGQSL